MLLVVETNKTEPGSPRFNDDRWRGCRPSERGASFEHRGYQRGNIADNIITAIEDSGNFFGIDQDYFLFH